MTPENGCTFKALGRSFAIGELISRSGSGCSQGTFLNQALFALDITLGGQAGSEIGPQKAHSLPTAAKSEFS